MTLFNNTDELQNFLPVNQGLTLENMQDDMDEALKNFILIRVPEEQITESLKPENQDDADHVEFLRLLKRANANLGFMLHFAQAKVTISDSGIVYPGTGDNYKQATDKDKEDVYKSVRSKGYSALQDILSLMYKNLTKFTIWKESEQYIDFSKLFIRNAKEFRIINNSLLVFTELYPYIEDIEVEIINEQLDTTLISSLKTAMKNDDLTETQQTLITNYIQPIIANYALAKGISNNSVGRDASGTISIYDDRTLDNPRSKVDVADTKLNLWHLRLTETADKRLSLMTKFIEDNASDLGIAPPTDTNIAFKPFRNDPSWGSAFF